MSTSDLIGWATHDLREQPGGITGPTHLVVGDDGVWFDVDRVRRAAARVPGARGTVLEGIGHDVLDGRLTELAPVRETS